MAEKDEKELGFKPEFDIVEEGEESKSQAPADKAGKGYADDERLSAAQRTEADTDDDDTSTEVDSGNQTADEVAARRERRKRERKAQKARQIAARDRDSREMHFLRTRNEQLERAVGSLDQRMSKSEVSQVEARLEQLKNARNEAEDVLAQAIEANNGGDVVKLNRTIRELEAGINRLSGYRQQLTERETTEEEAIEEPGEAPAQQRPPPSVIRNLQVFGTRHKWFDPNGSDEESQVVLALDAAVKAEGYDPATKDYWVELEDRMGRRLPERMKAFGAKVAGEADDDDDDEEEETPAPARRVNGAAKTNGGGGGPRMSSGSQTRGSGKQFLLSNERKQAMIEAGVWEDPELRDKYVRSYAEWDKAHPTGTR